MERSFAVTEPERMDELELAELDLAAQRLAQARFQHRAEGVGVDQKGQRGEHSKQQEDE